ncbi:MAG: aminotransferase class I/II-fold pyridoxal phosphate-dependent enzyme [Chloroflexi bacterium]|nr:aminotransferase class I/II-fold pyridoxal phosphate-dependent enzyme [Chloroflexota bacterium]
MTEQRIPKARPDLQGLPARPAGGARTMGNTARLNANEWAEPTSAGGYFTAAELEKLLLNRYPGPAIEIRQILARQYGVEPDQLLFGNGSADTILQLFLVFGGRGRRTLLFRPTFDLHARFTVFAGGTVADEVIGLPYELTRERALAAMERERPEIVVFTTPNNPTGTVIADDVMLAVAERFPETLVLVDEAYSDISGRTLLPALADHPNIVISKTFSKVHAAAGLRFGILIMHPDLKKIVDAVLIPFSVGVVTFALATKIARDEAGVKRRIATIRSERERVFAAMKKVEGIEPFPSEANFILFRIEGATAPAQARFLDHGIALRDMNAWIGAEGCLRVSIGTREENDRFIAALSQVFARAHA